MDKGKNKGLADNQDGEFVLNESGTSVSIDPDINFDENESSIENEDDKPENESDKS
jgi:hypothetical protein